MLVRRATLDDLPTITAIFNHEIATSSANFDIDPWTLAQRAEWMTQFNDTHPLFVCVTGDDRAIDRGDDRVIDRGDDRVIDRGDDRVIDRGDDRVLGFAYYLQYRAKAAYAQTKECTVYVAHDAQARGVGSRLYQALIDHARSHQVHTLLGVLTSGNTASEALHKKFGFVHVGHLREVGRKHDAWLDTDYWQLRLS